MFTQWVQPFRHKMYADQKKNKKNGQCKCNYILLFQPNSREAVHLTPTFTLKGLRSKFKFKDWHTRFTRVPELKTSEEQ